MSNLTDFVPGAMAKATQAQAQAGTADNAVMTPLRTAQQITARVASNADAGSGIGAGLMTAQLVPLAVNAQQRCKGAYQIEANGLVSKAYGEPISVSKTGTGTYTITHATLNNPVGLSTPIGTSGSPASSKVEYVSGTQVRVRTLTNAFTDSAFSFCLFA